MKKMSCWRLVFLVPVTILLVGCSLFRSGEKEPPTSPPPGATERPTPESALPKTPSPEDSTPVARPTDEGPVTLVLWTNEGYAPTSETEGGKRLLEQIESFQDNYGVRVDVVLKKRSGSGGLLDFLTTASKAAPSVLPDLITLSDADLYRAAQAGLLQPLDGSVSPALLENQFDFAVELTQLHGATMGILYQTDIYHLVYDTTAIDEQPRTWRDVYSSTVPFVFSPAAPSDGVNGAILVQYLAVGGELTDAAGEPALDSERLAEALTFFAEAQAAGVIPTSVSGLADATTAWAAYRSGEAGMVQVPASIYLAERAGLRNASLAPLPLRDAGYATVGHGWALAIVTQDQARSELAAALIEHLLAPKNNGTWTQAAARLPAQDSAFDFWDGDDADLPDIRQLLTQARPAVNPDLAAVVGGPLADALTQVLSGQATPEQAAEAAAQAVRGE